MGGFRTRMASSVGGVLTWHRKTFLSYQSMGETKSRQAAENLDKRVNDISQILFSTETDEKIKKLIKYHIIYEDSYKIYEDSYAHLYEDSYVHSSDSKSNFDLKVCDFIGKINQKHIIGFYRKHLKYKENDYFFKIKDEYDFIFSSDIFETDDFVDKIFAVYKKYRTSDNPVLYFESILELAPAISREISVQNIFEKIRNPDYSDAYREYFIEKSKFFKNKSKFQTAKAKYELIQKEMMLEAEAIIPFALHCKNIEKEKDELLKLCSEVNDIKRELEIIEAVHSGIHVDDYLFKKRVAYASAISIMNQQYL